MKAFIIKVGKKLMGRLLAHNEQIARKQAAAFWGQKKFDIKPVEKVRS